MFDALSQRLNQVLTQLKRKGTLTEADLEEGLREVRRALLEADVNYKVVKRFVDEVRAKAVGAKLTESLTPGQQVVKIVRDELATLMGQSRREPELAGRPAVWMLVGLQGSGKTTTAAKLAKRVAEGGERPLLVATDVRRPAAIDQLEQLGAQLGLPVHAQGKAAPEIARAAVERARGEGLDLVLLDTAGRLQIDQALMDELAEMRRELEPAEVLLVADAMTGQEAVAIAGAFHERVGLTGIVLTKTDGDARGGAALSMVEVTGVPVLFIGTGEKLDELEAFHPDRMAQRILGMGDVLGLIEDVERRIDRQKAEDFAKKLEGERFTLEDFREQLEQVQSLGPLEKILERLPGASQLKGSVQVDEGELVRVQAIIRSMTAGERRHPEILNASRKRRIAQGSGTQVSDVNRLLKRFKEAKAMMKRLKKMGGLAERGSWPL